MNILIIVNQVSRLFGGVTTHILDLCTYLKAHHDNVIIASNGGEYVQKFEAIGVKHIEIPIIGMDKNPLLFMKSYRILKKVVKENSIDVIHTHSQTAVLLAQLFKISKHIPYVWTSHIDDIPHKRIYKIMHKLFKFPIIAVSEDLKNCLMQEIGVKEKYISVIQNGVDPQKYTELSEKEKEKLKKEFQIQDEDFVISLLGRVVEVKGHQLLLTAIKELIQEKSLNISKIKVLFAGNVGDENYLKKRLEYAKENNINLSYVGFQNPRDVLRMSNLSVLPSYNEGFPIVCVESFFSKCPVVRSDVAGSIDMKDICLIFKKGNVEDFKEKLRQIINQPKLQKELVNHAYQEASKKYTLDVMGEKTVSVYHKIGVKS